MRCHEGSSDGTDLIGGTGGTGGAAGEGMAGGTGGQPSSRGLASAGSGTSGDAGATGAAPSAGSPSSGAVDTEECAYRGEKHAIGDTFIPEDGGAACTCSADPLEKGRAWSLTGQIDDGVGKTWMFVAGWTRQSAFSHQYVRKDDRANV